MNKEGMKTGERAITLEESSHREGVSVRRIVQDRTGCYYPGTLEALAKNIRQCR